MGKYQETSKKYADVFNKHDQSAHTKLYASDAITYDPMYPEPLRGRDAIGKDFATFIRAFPDIRIEMLSTIEKDERTGVDEMRLTGTHTGPLEAPTGQTIPPTNKRVELRGAAFVKLNDRGEIVEERRYYDVGTMLRQLGIVPEQAEEPAGTRR
jgi:steroid delta-isomerase-like uncharacterized protein